MTFFLGTYSIYTNGFQIPHLKEKKNRVSFGFARVPGQPAGSPGFDRAVATTSLLLNSDRSSYRVDRIPGRAGFKNSGLNISLFFVFKIMFVAFKIYI